MNQTFTLSYDKNLIRQAVFCFWRRTVGITLPIVLTLVGILICYKVFEGDRSWILGVMGAVWCIAFLFIVAVFIAHYSNSFKKYHQMNPPHAKLFISESEFSVSSSAGSATLPWSSITEIWRFQTFWLIFFSKSQFMTFPLETLPSDAQEQGKRMINT
jgi:hypothetical protein